MEHAVGVTVGNTHKDLVQNFLSMTESHLDADLRHVFVLVDVVFEVLVHEFEDEMQSGLIADDAFEIHDVGVTDLLQKGDLSDGSRRNSFILAFEPDLLDSNSL